MWKHGYYPYTAPAQFNGVQCSFSGKIKLFKDCVPSCIHFQLTQTLTHVLYSNENAVHRWPSKLLLPNATVCKLSFWLIKSCEYNNPAFEQSESKSVCTLLELDRHTGNVMLAHTGTSFAWVTSCAGSYRLRGGACWQWCSWQHWKRHTPTPHGPPCWEIWTVSCLLVGRCACPCWASLPLPEREIKKER